jgi:uncharacterized protein YkwD
MTKVLRIGYAAAAPPRRPRAHEGRPKLPLGSCLLRSIRTVRAALAARPFESLGSLLSRHRAASRVALAALSFIVLAAFSQEAAPIQAGPEAAPVIPETLLPQSLGMAVASDRGVTITFDAAMDPASVTAALQVLPAQKVRTMWSPDRTTLTIAPERLWRTDERYLVVVGSTARHANGEPLRAPRRFSFTTQTAPAVTDVQVNLADADLAAVAETVGTLGADLVTPTDIPGTLPPTETALGVSPTSSITVSFSAVMDRGDVEDHFVIAPHVSGELDWDGRNLVFTPTERLDPGARYTISVIGSRDHTGNLLGGKGNFSFIVQPGAQVTRTAPESDTTDAEPAIVEMWFSQPMDIDATNAAFGLTDASTGQLVGGLLNWNEAGTQLVYRPDRPFAGGRTFEVTLSGGARDAHGNPVGVSWVFTTKEGVAAAPDASRSATSTRTGTTAQPAPPAIPPPGPATSLAGHALNQVNAARAAYGFAPVVLDSAISAVAAAHAWDQARNGYFSHTGLNGSTRESRLRAGGVSFTWSGENQCYHMGMSEQATLDWCHRQFMAEPYPGHWNHIANILNPNARRMGVGIATVNGRTIITWKFTN